MTKMNAADLNLSILRFRILGQRIRVRCHDKGFRRLVLANYEAFDDGSGDATDIEYSVNRLVSGGFSISRDKELLVEQSSDDAIQYMLVYLLEKLITIDLQVRRPDLWFVHSSALERAGHVIMIAAEAGTGKSTTAWALLQHGFRYLSDELAPIDPARLDVHPYPHALCLKAPPPGPYPLPDATVRTERTMHIPVRVLPASVVKHAKPLRALFFLRRDGNLSVPSYAEVSPAEAGARLYANTLNVLAHPGGGLDVAIRIAAAVPAFVVNAGELRATCELISELEKNV